MTRRLTRLAALLIALVIASPASANERPGDFDYYVLVMSWSPTYCQTEGRGSRQCAGPSRHFVLHGLWPQYRRGWPDYCETDSRPWVPERLVDDMSDIMPGRGLIIHQYRKHGTCSGLSPGNYFDAARRAFASIRVPQRFRRVSQPLRLTPGEIERRFLQANPDLRADMISIGCGPQRLRDIRVCFSKELEPVSCGTNEAQGRLCRSQRTRVPPMR